MQLEEIRKKVLATLLQVYYRDKGYGDHDIAPILRSYGEDPNVISSLWQQRELIKDVNRSQTKTIAKIAINGILDIAPDYFDGYIEKIISHLILSESYKEDLMTILNFDRDAFMLAKDIATRMQDLRYIVVDQIGNGEIHVQLTQHGISYHNKDNGGFFKEGESI